MLLEARFSGLGYAVQEPSTIVAALVVLFILVAAALPARPDDYAGIPSRFGTLAVVAAVAGGLFAYQNDARRSAGEAPATIAVASAPGEVELRRTFDGHFRARAEIGDAEIPLMLDTGASIVLLRHDDAARVGLNMGRLSFSTPVTTANGRTRVAPVMLASIRIGDMEVRNVRAAVAQKGNLHTSLLGMSFLGELEEVSIRRDRMVLRN